MFAIVMRIKFACNYFGNLGYSSYCYVLWNLFVKFVLFISAVDIHHFYSANR